MGSYDDMPDWWTWTVLLGSVFCMLLFGASWCNQRYVKDICYRSGYSDVRASMLDGNYCVKRVDQTDVVVPFKDVERAMKGRR